MTDPFSAIRFDRDALEVDTDYQFPDEEIEEKIHVACKICGEACVLSPKNGWVHAEEIMSFDTRGSLNMHTAQPNYIEVQEVTDE